ncbi:SpaA isopeptide-forming pilin-related protein [Anaerococcus sp. NML200574]|uniref:SpaA isopeptide-forming pilin-related protein n=1 Tax=Anaerococcus sp. NML200574 TaxID=2954486 RepID=UPI0022384D2F|nr:SpaA isopeptide-forming pilin-related protein [Anaerococcus sp. NML200574]MCW6677610.1 SpaA isopeptide-forming pilin-related protein [Anaerococcus sp. NML200574]
MKGKLSTFARKTFALVIAISMSFPTGVIAAGEETKTYDKATSIMGLNEKPNEEIHQTGQSDNTDKLETDAYILQARASLADDLEKISYQVTISNKHKDTSDKDLSLKFTPNPNSNITDIRVKSAKAKIENKLADIDIKERSNKGEISSLIVDTKAYDEIIMEVEANVRKAKDARTYETLIGLDDGENKLDLNYRLITNKETVREENQDKEVISLDLNKDPSGNLRGEIKSGEFLSFLQSADTIVWTDYLVNSKRESEKITYDLKLDDKQDTKNTKITLDYFENTKEGFILKKEFSQVIPFANKIEFEIPAGYIAKLSLTTRVDKKNTKTKSYSLNNRQVKNPIYIEGNKETSNDDDEEGGEDKSDDHTHKESKVTTKNEDDKKKQVEKKEENKSQTQITAKDSSGNEIQVIEKDKKEDKKISALALNKDSLITRLSGQGKLTQELETAIEKLASNLDSYNDEKITDRELKDYTKALAEKYNIEKSDLRFYLESILSGVNKEKNKAANLNYDEIITYAYPEKKEERKAESVDKETKEKAQVENKAENKIAEPKKDAKEERKDTPKETPTENKSSKPSNQITSKEAVKAYKEDLAKLKESAKNEEKKGGLIEGIKDLFGQSDLAKADKELKAALADDKNGIEEIQNLLNSFEKKYKLSRADQARLMENNNAAIEALVAKDRNNNFRPHIFAGTESNKLNLEGKKFHILTRFDTSNATGPIQPGQFFNIILDKALTVKPGTKLEPIKYKGEVIAEPKYNSKDNIIEYKIVKEIKENTQFPLNIPVDYNAGNVELDKDGNFTVINKVSGLGLINPPKDLLPQKVDVNGNPAGSIIEPGRKDVTQIIEAADSNYKVDMDAYANPVVKDGELQGYNWTIRISSDTDLATLGLKTNFTTVKGSGLGDIKSNDTKVDLKDNPIKGAFGIHDSKHHAPTGTREITYNLYTPVEGMQEKYMMDISVILTNKKDKEGKPKVGAKRFVVDGWPLDKVKDATPTRAGMNNRTTILGEFTAEDAARWTVTDAVSTGDVNEGLPLETRTLGGNQKYNDPANGKIGIYEIDAETGIMKDVSPKGYSNGFPEAKHSPSKKQAVGTIVAYQYDTKIKDQNSKEPLSLAGVAISKYQDVSVEQNWNLDKGLKMPEMTLKAVDGSGNEIGEAKFEESKEANPDPATRNVTIPDVKVWNISDGGEFSKNDIKIKQDFPTTNTDSSGNTINYYENNNFYDFNKKGYYIHNKATVQKIPKFANFTLIKKDEKGNPLPGAYFKLLGQGEAEVVTDKDGQAQFSNISPGTYTLFETKAPKGYKLNQEKTTVSVDDAGRISTSGSKAELSVGNNPTVTVADPNWPDYMNAMQYATKDKNGNVTTYIFLKANEARSGGSTNRDTRLSLRVNGGEIQNLDDVKVYDVIPDYYRGPVRTAMIQQTVDQNLINQLGASVLNAPNNNRVIRGTQNIKDPFTGQVGYEITLPKERFANDWGFLVVAKSKPLGGGANTLTYDWLTSKETGNNAKLQNQTVMPTSTAQASKGTTITVKNEAFETRPVEIRKIDKKDNPIVGATFEIKDENGEVISTVTSQAADEKGQNAGLASFGKLPEGKYTIEEISAPDGYVKSDVIFEVTVDDSKQVTYKPKFKDGQGSPVNGEDYLITDEEQAQEEATAKINVVKQSLVINEGDSGDIGVRPQVWEAYRLESLKYNATIDLEQSSPGQRFSIQFDKNLDFTQYFGEFPKLNIGGVDVADPYFDYTTNKLTYVFNDKSIGGKTQAKIELKGIIPSKYYAQNDGTYPFTVTVAPGQTGITGQQKIKVDIPADYEQYDYDGKNAQVPQSYYFRDVYQDDKGDWYVAVLAYYNPVHVRTTGQKELKFNWLSTNYQGATKNFFTWEGNGNKPAFSLRDVKIYRTSPYMTTIKAGNFDKKVNLNMPLSYGVRPSQDPAKYNLVYSKAIDPRYAVNNDRQGSITLNYDPGQIQEWGVITKNAPLKIKMPAIDDKSKDGYIIEQTFKIDNLYNFNNLWRVFCMTNNDFKSSFITRANYNKATGDQAGGEIPKFYSQKVALINKRYTPGSFKIKKLDESDRSKTLQGATFSLTDKNNNVIYRSSGQDGIVDFSNLKPGIYTLKEENAPAEHIKSDKTWRVNVGIDGYVTIIEIGLGSTGDTLVGKDTIELPVTNKPVATKFTVYKKDNENVPLQGAKFKITTTDDTEVTTGTSDKNGVVSFDKKLEKGTYLLEEESAPAGFKKLDKKWVIEIGSDNKARVYNYVKGPETGTDPDVNKSILGEDGTKWVNVDKRPIDSWNLGDNRQTGYYNNWPVPFKLGTRIVGKNTKDPNNKYVIQRYVINPEADTITLNHASIHREKPWYNNMDWYAGNGVYKIFELNNAVDGKVQDIRLENYSLTDITDEVRTEKRVISGDNRLYLDFKDRQITKPIVIDVKVPYTSENAGVGTGMDLQTNKGLFWKSDYYESASQIVEGEPVVTKGEAGNIKGAYISEGSLDVSNEKIVQEFSFTKVDADKETDGITGATFKLQGPKITDEDLGKEVWKKSGTGGIVKFDNLVPGIYKLTESGAPQGYEKSNTDWTVTVTKDGKIYIRDNNPGSTVPDQGAKWQKLSADQPNRNSSNNPSKVASRITEVNKATGRFRQTFLVNNQPEYLGGSHIEIHAQPENRNLDLDNTKILSITEVPYKSNIDKLPTNGNPIKYNPEVIEKNGYKRLKITPEIPYGQNKTYAVTIESNIPNSGGVGTGMDFFNKYNGANNGYWGAEWYDSLDAIKLENPTSSSTDKNTRTYVGNTDASGRQTVMYANPTSKPVLYLNRGLMERALGYSLLNSPTPPTDLNSTMNFRSRSINTFADGLEIGDEIVGQPVQASGWQAVDPANSDNPDTKNRQPNQIQTKITHINKNEGKIRQIFLVNKENIKMTKARLDFHPEPQNMHLIGKGNNPNNFPVKLNVISVRPVSTNSTLDNIQYTGGELSYLSTNYNELKYWRNQLTLNQNNYQSPFVVEVEFEYQKAGAIGLGANYRPNRADSGKDYWAAESYQNGPSGINKSQPKITYRDGYEDTTIPMEYQTKDDPNLEEGQQRVEQGHDGVKRTFYKYEQSDGVDTGKKTLDTTKGNNGVEIIKEMKPQITYNGTKKPGQTGYSVSYNTPENGTLEVSPTTANAGDIITVTATPKENYKLKSLYYRDENGNQVAINGNTFKMPAAKVNVFAEFEEVSTPTNYTITVTQPETGGTISASPESAAEGAEITLTATPAVGYVLDKFTATSNGQEIAVNGNKFTMPAGDVSVSASFKESKDPLDSFVPEEGKDILVPDGETAEIVKITNKKAGINPKILKRSPGGEILPGATFTINKMEDATYSTIDKGFGTLTATSDEKGDVIFKDQAGNDIKLQKGYYVLKETTAPTGYKKSTADWKIEVKDDGGRMYAEYQGPEASPSSFINDNKKSNAGYSADNAGIKYKSRLTFIDTESKTYIQRIYIDTRAYNGTKPLNLQITPKYKREEKDAAGQHPETIKDGVKTAYFTAYKLSNPKDFNNMNDPELDKIIRTYDLANDNMSMIKTARWRPFDWGFDEDQLNLEKGVYIVDVEGFYDDVIITGKSDKKDKYNIPQEDLGKLDLHVDFYEGERHFKQLKLDENGNARYEAFDGASYQGGASEVTKYVKSQEGEKAAEAWSDKKDEGAKYKNFVGKEVKYKGKTYKTGIIDPPLGSPKVHADTRVDLNPLYNSKGHQEIPREGLEFINEEETFNITFSKHGRKDPKKDINSQEVTNNRLEGAVFKLQVRGPGGTYEDIPGTTVASAFNGYFGFRGLKPGRYRLMEVKAPEGYKPIKDPVLHFTIAYEKGDINKETGEITPGRGVVTLEYNEGNGIFEYAPDLKDEHGKPITPESGRLVDYVTSATAKNMGKIINEVPGKGEVTLTKKDDANNSLEGAEFKLTRISRDIKKDEDPKQNDGTYTKTTGNDGKIVFDQLPIGQYELEETKAPKGYQNKGKKWRFTVGGVGLDPYINDSDVGDRDISKSIEMTSTMSVLRPDGNDGTENEKNSKIHPHKGHALEFKNEFKIKDDTAIKAGDYFTIKLTDNIDLEGIMREKSQNLDLFADGVGTIAKAKYDKEAGTLTYVFTSYADQYNKTAFANTITAHINLYKVQNSSNKEEVGMGIKDTNFTKNNIAVVYDLDMAKNEYNNANMTSKIVSFDRESGEFVQYFYINRERLQNDGALTFKYKPSEAVSNLKFDFIRLDQNGKYVYNYNTGQYYSTDEYLKRDMPESFGVNERSDNLTNYGQLGPYEREANSNLNISIGSIGAQNSIILKVTGKVKGDNISSFDTYAQLFNKIPVYDYYGNTIGYNVGYYVERTNGVRIFENKTTASAELKIEAINPKNEIIFKKIDQEGKILPGAEFKLEKYYEDKGKWIEVTGSENSSDDKGLVHYEKLEPGKYALIETEAPEGYAKIEGHIQEFTVGEDGVITRQVVKEKPTEKPQSLIASIGVMVGSVASAITGDANTETATEPVSKEPINVINYKEIEFEKVDANNYETKLKGAEFEVHYKEKEDGKYQPYKVTKDGKEVTMTVTSGKDGKFKLPISKDGYYALIETKAPDGYTKVPGKIREFKLENGKVKTLEKDPLKASHKTSDKGQISSEIISVDMKDKTFKQRIIINPNHESMTIPSSQSYIRIKENDWKITPKYKSSSGFGLGGEVNVAILKKDGKKTLDKLTKDDYKKVDAISFTTVNKITGSRYGLKDMLGSTDTTDESITTTDAIVMEFTGKLDENNKTGIADQLFELIFDDLSEDDSIRDKLDVKALAENKPIYADHDSKNPIQVENKKAEYPFTKSVGTAIFTAIGLFFMVLAGYYYSRKKNKGLEIGNN